MSEHTGSVWMGGDDPSTKSASTVTFTDDDRVVVRMGGHTVADWSVSQVVMNVDGDVAELSVGEDRLMFEPESPTSWLDATRAVQMRSRLSQQPKSAPSNAPEPEPSPMTPTVPATYCRACGKQIDSRAELCPHCGVRQRQAQTRTPKSRTTAGILALLLGGIGVHRFYLGQIGLGVVYLVFSWTFIPVIVALIDAIILFTMSDETFDAKYNIA